jgi:hypothetical protein
MKTYTYDRTDQPGQYQLTLTDTGETFGKYSKKRVAYWLRNVDPLVHTLFEGNDLFVAPGQDPEGPQSASDALSFFAHYAYDRKSKDAPMDIEDWIESLENGEPEKGA